MGRERGLVPVWDGLIKVAAATPDIRVADCGYNAGQIVELCTRAAEQGVKVICFPELCVTGYTCGDLFLQDTLLRGAEAALEGILRETAGLDLLACVGVPVRWSGKLYNCAAVFCHGELLGLVPKVNIPNYTEFYEQRWFTSGRALGDTDFCIPFAGQEAVEFSTGLVFRCESLPLPLGGGGDLRGFVGGGHPLHPAVRRRGHPDPEPLRQRRDRQQGGLAAAAPPLHLRAAGVRLRLRRRGPGGELHRPGLRRPLPGGGGGAPSWQSAGLRPVSPSRRSTWRSWPTSGSG